MQTLNLNQISEISGGFSMIDFISSSANGAIIGAVIGTCAEFGLGPVNGMAFRICVSACTFGGAIYSLVNQATEQPKVVYTYQA